ncbi:MAG: YbhB/YbcL family Raf kinase inhibitor-like protein [Thermoflexia bacterium]|nr:MAG: YbhB/YbcL family Raf kinase inhibitor-like protein [Thermoflexia bacterium]
MALGLALMMAACARPTPPPVPSSEPTLTLTSPAFQPGGTIPETYTCEGPDLSPPLEWEGVPASAQSLALLCEDPDAPPGLFVHWVLYNLPATEERPMEGVPPLSSLTNGARQGKNGFGRVGYGGPCLPPGSTHRYFFRLYALDTVLDLPPEAMREELLKAMEGHILAWGELMGRFGR